MKSEDRPAGEAPVARKHRERSSQDNDAGDTTSAQVEGRDRLTGSEAAPPREPTRNTSPAEVDDDSSERPSDRAPARTPGAGERRLGEGENSGRPERQGRSDRGPRGGRGGRGDRRDRPERTERPAQNRSTRDEDLDDDDDTIEVHRGDESALGAEDPLALSYEFEPEPDAPRPGRSRRGEGRDHAPARARIQTAKEFFSTEILYRHDLLERETRAQIASVYRIELKGNKGGVWTVTAADDLQIVNRREEAELVFTMQHRDFISLVNGDLNPQLAMLAQKIKVQGDYRKAVIAFSLLAPVSD